MNILKNKENESYYQLHKGYSSELKEMDIDIGYQMMYITNRRLRNEVKACF